MDDLNEKLDRLLSSPDGLKQIGDLMAALGGEADNAPPPPPVDMPDLSQIMKLMPLIGMIGKEDNNTALLSALRPHLSAERQKRLDEAGQFLKIAKLLPLLKDMKGEDDGGS